MPRSSYIPYSGPIVTRKQAKSKSLTRYFTGKICRNGHSSQRRTTTGNCVECTKDYKIENPQNPIVRRKAEKKWRDENKDKVAAYAKKDRAKHGKKRVAKRAEWAKANPKKVRASQKANEHMRRGAEGKFTGADIKRIGELQKWLCAYCKIDVSESYCVDHIQPLAKGGTNWPRNLQIACRPCNARKSAKDPIDWAQEIGLLL